MSETQFVSLKDLIVSNRANIPTFFYGLLLDYLPEELLGYEVKKVLRLLVIVAGYLLIRKLVLRHQVIRAKQEQYEKEKDASEQVGDLFAKDEEDTAHSTGVKEAGWGWGQKTKKDIKAKQEFLKNLQKQKDESDDEDIQDLLIDD